MKNYKLKKYVVISCINFGLDSCIELIDIMEDYSLINFPYNRDKYKKFSIMNQFIEDNYTKLKAIK